MTKVTKWFMAIFVLSAFASFAHAQSRCVDTDCVPAGFDYFRTQPGTFFTINGTKVPLFGIPDPSHYGADTIIQRLKNVDVPDNPGATETVDLLMTELQLRGVDPMCPQIGNKPCRVFINLDPNNSSTGSLAFTQTVAGEAAVDPSCGGSLPCEGTYTSFFDVFFDVSFTTKSGAPLPCDPNGDITCLQPDLTLTGTGSWTDDNHGDFIVGNTVDEKHFSPAGEHRAHMTPEPGSIALFGTGVAGLFGLVRKRHLRG